MKRKISHTAYPNATPTFNEWMRYVYSEVASLRIPKIPEDENKQV